ncbi:alpha/beta hydrolase [Martelella sp. HB161492]|uniref:alpha/beta fold hydrolase n=1 Tax=Martelella sp. HB161492 TaxID=2720726 RepID=UPI001591059B|nr:alpha/beta hydrolase [Martelella sp. HB161492]
MNFATVNGISLRYDLRPGDGVPLVLLHEMGGAIESFDLVVRALPGRTVLRLDLRGFGLSEKPAGPLSMENFVDDVIALMDHLDIAAAHLAGCAVGGGVALAAAARLGGRAASLTAMAPATGVPPERRDGLLKLADMLEENGVRGFLEADTIPKAWPGDHFDRGSEGFAIFLATQLGTSPATLARTYRMLADLDLAPAFAAITCPTTLIAGQYDIARPPVLIETIARQIPGARAVTVASGHFMALQNPDIVAGLLVP